MHAGRTYPYLADLWAVSNQWWPGFVPRKLWLAFDGIQDYPWTDVAGYASASIVGVPNAIRETVTYDFPPPVGYTRLFVTIGTAMSPVKSTAYNLVLIGGPLQSNAGAFNVLPGRQFTVSNGMWPAGPPVLPNIVYVPPDAGVRPALWSEV